MDEFFELQPLPALVVETATGRVVRANAAARAAFPASVLAARPGADGYATEAGGERIEAGDLTRHLAARATGAAGIDITWHTPQRESTLRVWARPLPPGAEGPARSLLTFVDISDQRAVEAELRRALELRGEFFSVATHELKDPLFALHLSLQLLRHTAEKQGAVPEHVRRHLEVSQRQAERLNHLIENLLDVSRIANGRVVLDLEPFDLCDLVREMVDRFQVPAASAGSTLRLEDGQPTPGRFDRLKIEQVVGNLLSNALKYGAGRPVTVRVRPAGEWALVEVEDQGVGIAPADQARVFERFERASQGHKKESLGLGLYIVRSLTEAHGGTVAVRSEPGRGATFTVTLPRHPRPGAEEEPATGSDGPAPTGG